MNANELLEWLNKQIAVDSNYDVKRHYLGISKISACPRKIYDEYVSDGIEPDEMTYRFCFAGYEQERSILGLLQRSGVGCLDNGMVVKAPFDDRLQGHIDGLTNDGDLLEIKSLSLSKFELRIENNKASFGHIAQVQLYMRYGGWKNAYVIYRCREDYRHIVFHIPYDAQRAERLEQKAKQILRAIDNEQPPACECGHCGG